MTAAPAHGTVRAQLDTHERHPKLFRRLASIDRCTATWPVLASMGDHFLVVMHRR